MPAKIQINRGDIRKRKIDDLRNGQFFWSYINEDPFNNNPQHSYSRGQLWIKDPSSAGFTEIADRRTLNALLFKGFIYEDFKGDFINASEKTQIDFCRCHVGDAWIFKCVNKTDFKVPFFKGDILLITKAIYEDTNEENSLKSSFPDKLSEVDYIRIPGSEFYNEYSDLEAETLNDAILELEYRLNYKGEISTEEEFLKASKKKGNMYILIEPLYLDTSKLDLPFSRATTQLKVKTKIGDFVYWNGKKWVLIPSGMEAKDIKYEPNKEEIESVTTFETSHIEELESSQNVQEALDILNRTKAQLNSEGKVPLSQLPDFIRRALSFVGIFYPVKNSSETYKNDIDNQNEWPELLNEEGISKNGQFWIVDCKGVQNVQYIDRDNEGRVVELNSGDWIVWTEATGKFEIIDNSDQLSAIEVYAPDLEGVKQTLQGVVGITVDHNSNLQIKISDHTIIISEKNPMVVQDASTLGRKNYFSKYKDERTLTPGPLYHDEENEKVISEYGFQVGAPLNERNLDTYGDVIVRKTPGTQGGSPFINNVFALETFFFNTEGDIAERLTRINSSMRKKLAGDLLSDIVDVTLPEATSLLVGILDGEEIAPEYLTKSSLDGFITETLNREFQTETGEYFNDYFKENLEDGFLNVGYGRTVSEDVDLGEITFYAKTKDYKTFRKDGTFLSTGFYTQRHSYANKNSKLWDKDEHFLNRDSVVSRTHLVINPSIIAQDELENFVKMPYGSGTLLLWEDFFMIFGNPGVPLMIPAWEKMHYDVFDFVGLDTSPITIRLNRPKSGWTSVERINNLAGNYGEGDKSTWSYIDSNKEGSLQNDDRGAIDDVVSFDSWLEAQRSIATKEAFIIPSTATKDGLSRRDPITDAYVMDPEETKNDKYGSDKSGGKYQRILPSRTLYKNESVYYDYHTGELIKQDVKTKDVEMPAEGGVLLTSRSKIDGGIYI